MMVLPLPAVLLDVLITVNLSIALTIVLLSLYTQDALELSVFPSLLLFTTLFRLAINVSVTRLILLHGDAGSVIHAFGSFVVGGNVVVGLVVFLILVVIQFVVITNGAGRVAEVAARFTLDAMPGKQMAIDADLNAGLITDDEARERRDKIQREADFYGAMDGASKFVKGDAVAGIVIVGDQPARRHHDRHAAMQGKGFGDALHDVLAADDRRRPRRADPGAADLDRHRHHRHARRHRRGHEPRHRRRRSRCCATRGRCSSPPIVLGLLRPRAGPAEGAVPAADAWCSATLAFGVRSKQRTRGDAARAGGGGGGAEGAAGAAGRGHEVAQPRHARAGDRLRPDPARGRVGGRRAAEARRPGAQADGVRARPRAAADPDPRQRAARLARVRGAHQGLRGGARPARRRLPAGDEPRRRRSVAAGRARPSSRPSACRRCGSPRAPASRRRRRATPSSTTPRSSSRTSRRPSASTPPS